MSQSTKIEWTDATWNPVRGCTKISPGCAHCYAETFAERWRGVPGHPFEQGFDLRLVPESLTWPLKQATPKRIFVNSMSDLFHAGIPASYLDRVVSVMQHADWHVFQVLTKRADRMRGCLERWFAPLGGDAERTPLRSREHIWWGVSVENRRHGFPRIDALRWAPAAVRFLSIEPLLEDLGTLDLSGIHWVIVGGESGPGARPMRADWVRSIRDQCGDAGVPFFFKQWGGHNKAKAGRELDGRTHDDMPPITPRPVPPAAVRQELMEFLRECWR